MGTFSSASLAKLATCVEPLQRVFNEVVKHRDCTILEGARTETQERQHILDGTSKLTDPRNGRHVVWPEQPLARAVDVAPYPVDWTDMDRFRAFGGFVLGIATMMGIKLRWGGDWDGDWDFHDQSFNDLVHFEVVEG